jgi:hypothetical protein
MAQPASRISFLSSFADFVRKQRDAIGRTGEKSWGQISRACCPKLFEFGSQLIPYADSNGEDRAG